MVLFCLPPPTFENMRQTNNRNHQRADKDGTHRKQFEINRRRVLATQSVCGICGRPVDKSLKWPDEWCAVVDHIIPIERNGHPSDIDNLQLAHNICNRNKAAKLFRTVKQPQIILPNNDDLPLSEDWDNIRFDG